MIRRFRAKPLPPSVLLAVGLVVVLMLAAYVLYRLNNAEPRVSDFQSCVAAGNPVAESSPRRCFYRGQGFIEQ